MKKKTPPLPPRCMFAGMRVKKPVIKVTRAQRPTYDRCHAAMLDGVIRSWAIDSRTAGGWLLMVTEGTWIEMDQAGVNATLDALYAPALASAA